METSSHSRAFQIRANETIEGYQCLLRVEVALRQLVIEELSKAAGPKWHKQRLPPDLCGKLAEGPKYERSYKWFEFIPHHPICYLDFPDLQKVVTRADNWSQCFASIFGHKENFQTKYRDIELIRNKVAHSRLITEAELTKLNAFEAEVSTCIGRDRYSELLDRYLPVGDIPEQLRSLASFFLNAAADLSNAKPITVPPLVDSILNSWWFDSEFLPLDHDLLSGVVRLLHCYIELPREPRDGHKVERWLNDCGLLTSLRTLSASMNTLADEG